MRLARCAKEAGVRRFVFASSCSLYGAGGATSSTKTADFHPVTPYGESKVKVEQDVAPLADASFSPVYLRNATAYGVSRRLRADIVVNNLVGHAFTTGKVLLQSDGTPWRPLVHHRDISAAFLAVLEAPRGRIHNQAFNVGPRRRELSDRQVAEMVAEVVPHCEVAFAAGASADTRDYRVDFSKIAKQVPELPAPLDAEAGNRGTLRGLQACRPHEGGVPGATVLSAEDHSGAARPGSPGRQPASTRAEPLVSQAPPQGPNSTSTTSTECAPRPLWSWW